MIPNCQKSCDVCTYERSEQSAVTVLEEAQTEPEVRSTQPERNTSANNSNTTSNGTNMTDELEGSVGTQNQTDSGSGRQDAISSAYHRETSSTGTDSSAGTNTTTPPSKSISSTGSILLDAISLGQFNLQ